MTPSGKANPGQARTVLTSPPADLHLFLEVGMFKIEIKVNYFDILFLDTLAYYVCVVLKVFLLPFSLDRNLKDG